MQTQKVGQGRIYTSQKSPHGHSIIFSSNAHACGAHTDAWHRYNDVTQVFSTSWYHCLVHLLSLIITLKGCETDRPLKQTDRWGLQERKKEASEEPDDIITSKLDQTPRHKHHYRNIQPTHMQLYFIFRCNWEKSTVNASDYYHTVGLARLAQYKYWSIRWSQNQHSGRTQ